MNGDSYKYIRSNITQETRWATKAEIEQSSSYIDLNSETYPAAGIPLLSNGVGANVDNSDTHSLIFGSTGSKKTRLFCMPMVNIFAKANESFIVTDPKGEIYAQTSGLVKERGYKTVVLNFRDLGKGDMWNPLSLPSELWSEGLRDEAGFLMSDFVATISEKQAATTKDAFWPEAAQSIAIANLYVLMEAAKKEEINVTSFTKLCAFDAVAGLKELYAMLDKDSIPSLNYQSTVCIRADQTVSGMISTLSGMLRVFNVNKKLSTMLSFNTFDMRKIGREKTAVYIIVPDEKTTYHFLVTTFIKQTYEILIAEAQKEKNRQLPVRVNFLLDEFCNIPKIPDMPSMISAARSRNMRFYLVAQSMHQLRSKYGEDADTIKGNCENWVFLASKELSLLNEVSELCGNIVEPNGRTRRLISASELQRLSKQKGEALIFHARQYPIISELPDISAYKMFGIYPAVEMDENTFGTVSTFSLRKRLNEISNLTALAPFASQEHLISQASKILGEEILKKFPDKKPKRRGRLVSRIIEEEEKPETEEEKAKRMEIYEECKQLAKVRIAELISPEFAEEFIKNGTPHIEDTDDADDYDLFNF